MKGNENITKRGLKLTAGNVLLGKEKLKLIESQSVFEFVIKSLVCWRMTIWVLIVGIVVVLDVRDYGSYAHDIYARDHFSRVADDGGPKPVFE